MVVAAKVNDANRVVFLDNLRYLMVLLVVVVHAATSYSIFVPWWAVRDTTSIAMDVILVGLDIFLMPVLFFIAGYFGVSSFRRHGAKTFLKKKLKRLGVPLLVSAPITGCLFAYIYHYTRGSLGIDAGLWSHWRGYMASALEFHIGQIPAIRYFSHFHLWFMSVLLFFFVLYTIISLMTHRTTNAEQQPSPIIATDKTIYVPMGLVVLGSTLSLITGTLLFATPENPEPWFTIANLVQFQPHKLVMYALYFGLGVYAFHAQWFSQNRFPGRLWVWTVLAICFFIIKLVLLKQMMTAFSRELLMLWLLVHSICCITALASLLRFSVRHWNRPRLLDSILSNNSYHIYITHFIVTFLLQLLLLQWTDGPVLMKFGLVSIASIMVSLGLSHYFFKPYAVRAVVGLAVGFGIALAIVHPGAV